MAEHIAGHREGFGWGRTDICLPDDSEHPTGLGLAVHRLKAGETLRTTVDCETAWLLMEGTVEFEVGGGSHRVERASLYDDLPYCAHVAAGDTLGLGAVTDAEITIYTTPNSKPFAAKFYFPKDVRNERRGEKHVGGACFRFVRTIFDGTNTDSNSELVLGEVITLPGRWSSYPPHHHAQPEIYHYRFDKPQGYGHAELGERVLKVRNNDAVKIFDGNDHSQAAAPGYTMYYSWVIRHLPEARYTVPEFTEDHAWTMSPDASIWEPPAEDT